MIQKRIRWGLKLPVVEKKVAPDPILLPRTNMKADGNIKQKATNQPLAFLKQPRATQAIGTGGRDPGERRNAGRWNDVTATLSPQGRVSVLAVEAHRLKLWLCRTAAPLIEREDENWEGPQGSQHTGAQGNERKGESCILHDVLAAVFPTPQLQIRQQEVGN